MQVRPIPALGGPLASPNLFPEGGFMPEERLSVESFDCAAGDTGLVCGGKSPRKWQEGATLLHGGGVGGDPDA